MDPIGKSPIPLPLLLLGKLAVLVCWLFFFARSLGIALLYDWPWMRVVGLALALTGLCILVIGFIHLGTSVRVGLPKEETELKTKGIYAVTRNPLYVGGFFVCLGSCSYSLHPLNVFMCLLAVAIHHSIVLKEEKFLRGRFGSAWEDYARRVPRYAGRIRD